MYPKSLYRPDGLLLFCSLILSPLFLLQSDVSLSHLHQHHRLFLFFSFSRFLSLPRLLSSSLTCSVSLSIAISRLFLGFIEPFYTRLPCLLLSLSLSQVRVFIQCLFCILHFSTFTSALSLVQYR